MFAVSIPSGSRPGSTLDQLWINPWVNPGGMSGAGSSPSGPARRLHRRGAAVAVRLRPRLTSGGSASVRVMEDHADQRRRLVGRDAEMAALTGAVRRAHAGRAGLVLVEGPAGIGKTALVETVLGGLGAQA